MDTGAYERAPDAMTFNLTGKSNAITFVVAYGPTDTACVQYAATEGCVLGGFGKCC